MRTSILENKKILFIFSLLINLSFAQDINDWTLLLSEEAAVAQLKTKSKIKINLIAESGDPRLISWEKITERKNIWSLKYFSGASGTSTLIESYRQVLIEMPSGKKLIDLPYEYKVLGLTPKEQKQVAQPKWEWNAKGLRVSDLDYPGNNVFMPYKQTP